MSSKPDILKYTLILVLVVFAIVIFLKIRANQLAVQQAAVLEDSFLASKRTELKSYMDLALSLVGPLYNSGHDDAATKDKVKNILQKLSYGYDGYFFAYDAAGTNLVHPRQPGLIGKNLWEMTDVKGQHVIQLLQQAARSGNGYQLYEWEKPSTHKITEKLGYVVLLERWGWMVGTGIYLEDVDAIVKSARTRTEDYLQQLTGVALFSVLLICAVGFSLFMNEQQNTNRQLNAMAQRIVTLQEEERARVSRELHDGICQLLVSVKYQFDLAAHKLEADGHPVAEDMRNGLEKLKEAIVGVRDISHDLRPAILDTLGLHAAVVQLTEEFSQRMRIAVTVINTINDVELSRSTQVALFRIAQEGLSNVERHAIASTVTLTLSLDETWVRMSIADNGRSFDVAELRTTPGIGLRNIRERINILDGSFHITSVPGCTTLSVILPRST